jgi:hypothetical protein
VMSVLLACTMQTFAYEGRLPGGRALPFGPTGSFYVLLTIVAVTVATAGWIWPWWRRRRRQPPIRLISWYVDEAAGRQR